MLLEYAGSTKEPSEVQVEVPELGGVTWLNPAHLQPVRLSVISSYPPLYTVNRHVQDVHQANTCSEESSTRYLQA